MKRLRNIGPAALVTAAFIGPGTITTCTLAGANYGYALLWGLVFSVIATVVLQEMSARLGVVSQHSLSEALRIQFSKGFSKYLVVFLVVSAIAIGNAAYETGNIIGGVLGVEAITGISQIQIGKLSVKFWGIIIGLIAFFVLYRGSYKLLERALIALVIIMSISFLLTAILSGPELIKIIKGMVVPRLPKGSLLTLVALIGTTVVPYNLFLHSSAVKERWKRAEDLSIARTDIFVSIILGGLISMAIVVSSATAFFGTNTEITGAGDMAVQLEPLLGKWATYFISLGMFAAGISSAITAPLAAAYATSGILGWNKNLKSTKHRLVWIIVLAAGVLFSTLGFKPVQAIVFAQLTNGILLPVIAIFLLWTVNNKKLLGTYTNGLANNILAGLVVLITVFLGIRSVLSVFHII